MTSYQRRESLNKQSRSWRPPYLILVLVVMVVCVVGLLTLRPSIKADDTYSLEEDTEPILKPHSPTGQAHNYQFRAPLPMWGQGDHNELQFGPLSGIPILMLVASEDLSIIQRSSGNKRFLSKFIHGLSVVDNLKNIIDAFSGTNVCVKDAISPVINTLNTGSNMTDTGTRRPTVKELERERGAIFASHPYNPMHRKAVINSREEEWKVNAEESVGEDLSRQKGNTSKQEKRSHCQKSKNLKEALKFVKASFPELQFLMLLETGYALSPDFVSYYKQTVEAMKEDPSIYCISAHNPLASAFTSGNVSRVYRFDHFVGKATLIPSKVVSEILKDFVIYQDKNSLEQKSALESLEVWLSWWSRRRRRGCVVPDVPRICRLYEPSTSDTSTEMKAMHEDKHDPLCSQESHVILVNSSRLLHYKYCQDIFSAITAAEPLGGNTIDCNDPQFFPEKMNASIYAVYIKMEHYADDLTFHHIMKCFGLTLASPVGYFEGIFQFTFRRRTMLVMSIPYSRFAWVYLFFFFINIQYST
ncbi:O-linked-mannose beta-1-2-N-acetylglucosaminyltransferase 1-like 28, partial [Homarus americanus]